MFSSTHQKKYIAKKKALIMFYFLIPEPNLEKKSLPMGGTRVKGTLSSFRALFNF